MSRAALALLGGYVCILGIAVHRHSTGLAGITVPWGVLLALVATCVVAVAAAHWVPLGAAWVALGWTVTLLLQEAAASGSVLVAGDGFGWGFMLGCLALLTVAVVRAPRAL